MEQLEIEDLHIRLFVARQIELRPNTWAFANVQDSFWRLYMNNRDGAALGLANGRYELAAGQLYFVPAGIRFNCMNTATVGHFYIHFDVLGLPRAALRTLFSTPCQVPSSRELEQEALELAGALGDQGRLDVIQQCRGKGLLYRALGAYLTSLPAELIEHYRRLTAAYAPVRPALHEIEEALAERLTNRELARL